MLAVIGAKRGRVPNMLLTMAHAPALLRGYVGLSEALAYGLLTAREREMVALGLAEANQCAYCVAAHGAYGSGVGLSEDDIAAARRGTGLLPRERAVVELATHLTLQRGVVDEPALAQARAGGLSDALMLEVVGLVGLNLLSNYVNHFAQPEIDFAVD